MTESWLNVKRVVSVDELSKYLGTPKGTLYQWVSQRRIPFVKLGRSTRFDLKEIETWIKENSHKPIDIKV